MACPPITTDAFKTFFARNFTFGDTLPDVLDADIDKAFAEACAVFNEGLYPDDATTELVYGYLAAHFLQEDLNAAEGGGAPTYNVSSHSADGISESLAIPEWMNAEEFAFYSTTYYGQKFLILSKPYLDGAVFVVTGATTA